jgi:SAM-dependent methyltransferase
MKDTFYESRDTYGNSDKWNNDRQKICLNFIKKINPKNFLDIWSGDGYFCEQIKTLTSAEVTGIDISEQACDIAKKRGIHSIVWDLQKSLPFESESFDTIFCWEVIEHIVDTDFLLDEIQRVLKKDGYLILTTPNLVSWYNRILFLCGIQPISTEVSFRKKYGHVFKFLWEGWLPVGHVRNFTQQSLTGILGDHGFDIEKVQASGWLNSWRKWSVIYRLDIMISHIFSSLGSNLIVLARKNGK